MTSFPMASALEPILLTFLAKGALALVFAWAFLPTSKNIWVSPPPKYSPVNFQRKGCTVYTSPNISPQKKTEVSPKVQAKNRWIQPSTKKGGQQQQQTTTNNNPTVLAGGERDVVLRNTIPGDKSAMNPNGLRVGTPAMTSRGLMEVPRWGGGWDLRGVCWRPGSLKHLI